ncbi:hypothetical protein BFP77_02400 [Maribacter sp. 4U21]|uniref:glycosyltransferase n=1 Tax=Maribacter sp. 4U21 TaxID=1889779 RepID=UPI000C15CC84|nr:glycosyltransferase [Maribacter sp. 4U21]PIB31202.1 hypothetical protein BFP77_02400 [Maribacter sp. 4U21]
MSSIKSKILLVIPNLAAGGAEKVMSFLAQNLNKDQFETKLIVIGNAKDSVYDTSNVETVYLNKSHVKSAFFTLFNIINKENPHIVFSSLSHVNTLMGLISYLVPKTIFVGRETIVSSAQDNFSAKGLRFFIFRTISKIAYKGLKVLISQSEDMKNDLIAYQGFHSNKIVTINNPISDNFTLKSHIPPFDKTYEYVTVGRLTEKKGHARILESLSTLNIPFRYTIIGDGPEKDNIFKLASTLGLADHIRHIPFTKEVNSYLKQSHIYLQGSFVEGFPNALLECLAVGTPAIVFDAPGGINEIIINAENGYITKNENDFREKIITLSTNLSVFDPEKVQKHVRNNYSSKHIMTEYESLFNKLIGLKGKIA